MATWGDSLIACQIHIARLYTQKYPKDMYGWVVLADALATISSYDEAILALRRAKRLSPKDKLEFIFDQIGHFYMEKGDHRRAESWYRKAVGAKETGENLIYLGACLGKQGKRREAKQCYRRAIKMGSEVIEEAYFNLGVNLRAEDKFDEALECFERAIEIDPKYALAKKARKDIVTLRKLKEGL